MIDGLIFLITAYASPSPPVAPGANLSTTTSAFFPRSLTSARPFGSFRLTVIDFLLALNRRKYGSSTPGLPPSARPGSPLLGFSSFTTSAPSQASASVQDGPASNCVRSRTLTPVRQVCPPPTAFMSVSPPFRPGRADYSVRQSCVSPKPAGSCGPTWRRCVFFHNGVFHTLQEVQDSYAFRDVQPGLIYPRKHDGTVEKYDDIPPRFRADIDIGDAPRAR